MNAIVKRTIAIPVISFVIRFSSSLRRWQIIIPLSLSVVIVRFIDPHRFYLPFLPEFGLSNFGEKGWTGLKENSHRG